MRNEDGTTNPDRVSLSMSRVNDIILTLYNSIFELYDLDTPRLEVTTHVPYTDWYRGDVQGNELSYWGLDYPPLTALHSGVLGYIHVGN